MRGSLTQGADRGDVSTLLAAAHVTSLYGLLFILLLFPITIIIIIIIIIITNKVHGPWNFHLGLVFNEKKN